MAQKSRRGNQYGDVSIGGRASLWQGDDNRNFGNIIRIEKAYLAFRDAQNLPNELLAQLHVNQQNQDHHGSDRTSYLLKKWPKPSCQNATLETSANIEYEKEALDMKHAPEEDAKAVSTANPVKNVSKHNKRLFLDLYKWLHCLVERSILKSFRPRSPQSNSPDWYDEQTSPSRDLTSLVPATTNPFAGREMLILCAGILSTLLGRHIST
ncbi:hypothetical protein H2198_006809 [Neophaeococcomyces mojaviensis]|uniref:Uncharacterized protein n=1 Tax=Neophaeococcomyces mojaviensis TaxID=3383035 RepID=A0ACC3A1Y2_9EURO|nr:hypothetical protein H2198_006809 [Knufia sp. JES_112]